MTEESDTISPKCEACPRPGKLRLRAVANHGRAGGYVLEQIYLCDSCALLVDVL